ncbi:MAG TPA: protein translocase subunit SecD [Myxococcota bacterium]|jgi:preprotein translocase subunit SecD|nr:protein translocase subunit SecD [Myxococcota bacterium]
MPRIWLYKVLLVLFLVLGSVLYLVPSLAKTTEKVPVKDPVTGVDKITIVEHDNLPSWYPAFLRRYVNLGLDLQGGLLLVYHVDVEAAVYGRVDRWATDIEGILKEESSKLPDAEKFTAVVSSSEGQAKIVFTPPAAMDKYAGEKGLLDKYGSMRLLSKDPVTGTVVWTLRDDRIEEIRKYAVDQALETISTRVNKLGVKEPSISVAGGSNIVIQMPGLSEKDFDSAKKLIDQVANLEFKMVDDENKFIVDLVKAGKLPPNIKAEPERVGERKVKATVYLTAPTKDDLILFFKANPPPPGYEIGYEEEAVKGAAGETTVETKWRTYLLKSRVELTGEYLTDARVEIDQRENKPYVSISFDAKGATIFEELTAANVDNRMAILLDGKVNSAPVIKTKIAGGRAQITMGGYKGYNALLDEANQLVIVLQAGALPAPIYKDFETAVGPQLGSEAVRVGLTSLVIGAALVILFMGFYYRGAGLIANLALLLNLLFLSAIMALLGATLTLPGIEGIVLTLGMAVDANVIINERIREELRVGKSPRAAIDAGYNNALRAIIDSNLTTAIAGVVLLQFGSGPIKGFAVTLLVGLATSLFTATTVTRLVFDWLAARGRVQKLSI